MAGEGFPVPAAHRRLELMAADGTVQYKEVTTPRASLQPDLMFYRPGDATPPISPGPRITSATCRASLSGSRSVLLQRMMTVS